MANSPGAVDLAQGREDQSNGGGRSGDTSPAQTRAEWDVVADAILGEMELKEWAAVVVGGMSRQTLK